MRRRSRSWSASTSRCASSSDLTPPKDLLVAQKPQCQALRLLSLFIRRQTERQQSVVHRALALRLQQTAPAAGLPVGIRRAGQGWIESLGDGGPNIRYLRQRSFEDRPRQRPIHSQGRVLVAGRYRAIMKDLSRSVRNGTPDPDRSFLDTTRSGH